MTLAQLGAVGESFSPLLGRLSSSQAGARRADSDPPVR
jgi:hypothetical protein